MGCDIHLFVERPSPSGGWENVDPPADWSLNNLDHSGPDKFGRGWFWDRNYELFAWLADVRNRHDQPVLAEPRGLPTDAAKETRREYAEWDCDGHSHTWFAVAEFDGATTTVNYGGLLSEDDYVAWKGSGADFPASWCQGWNRTTISEADYIAGERPTEPFGIRCEWQLPARIGFARWFKLMGAVKEIAGNDARVVLWFDN
jgi:hypothetical protein